MTTNQVKSMEKPNKHPELSSADRVHLHIYIFLLGENHKESSSSILYEEVSRTSQPGSLHNCNIYD